MKPKVQLEPWIDYARQNHAEGKNIIAEMLLILVRLKIIDIYIDSLGPVSPDIMKNGIRQATR